MSQVKVLYVRNITSDISENDVKDLFLPYGNIERVRKVRVRISTRFKVYKKNFL
jgi:RNA recognition motif-containing protein